MLNLNTKLVRIFDIKRHDETVYLYYDDLTRAALTGAAPLLQFTASTLVI